MNHINQVRTINILKILIKPSAKFCISSAQLNSSRPLDGYEIEIHVPLANNFSSVLVTGDHSMIGLDV
jgi:hypothetical protein